MRTGAKRKQSHIGTLLILATVFLGMFVSSIRVIKLRQESRELAITEQALVAELEEQNMETERLEKLEAYMKTRKYIEDVAKDKLNLVYPGEYVLKPNKSK